MSKDLGFSIPHFLKKDPTVVHTTENTMPEIPQELYNALINYAHALTSKDAPDMAIFEAEQDMRGYSTKWYLSLQEHKQQTPEKLSPNNIFAMFDKAAEKLRYPKLYFTLPSGLNKRSKLVLSLAGDRAKCPGTINITDGGTYPDNMFYGRLWRKEEYPTGAYYESYKNVPQGIREAVEALLSDPQGYSKMSGQAYSHCCFCGKEIVNKNSLTVGYGPICAQNWGLPWEGTAEAAKLAALDEDLKGE